MNINFSEGARQAANQIGEIFKSGASKIGSGLTAIGRWLGRAVTWLKDGICGSAEKTNRIGPESIIATRTTDNQRLIDANSPEKADLFAKEPGPTGSGKQISAEKAERLGYMPKNENENENENEILERKTQQILVKQENGKYEYVKLIEFNTQTKEITFERKSGEQKQAPVRDILLLKHVGFKENSGDIEKKPEEYNKSDNKYIISIINDEHVEEDNIAGEFELTDNETEIQLNLAQSNAQSMRVNAELRTKEPPLTIIPIKQDDFKELQNKENMNNENIITSQGNKTKTSKENEPPRQASAKKTTRAWHKANGFLSNILKGQLKTEKALRESSPSEKPISDDQGAPKTYNPDDDV
jgi:hypothetical protein